MSLRNWRRSLLPNDQIKEWMQQELGRIEKVLLILSTFNKPASVSEIKEKARNVGFKFPTSWNISSILSRFKTLAVRMPEGWEITNAGKMRLRSSGVTNLSPISLQVAVDLRQHLDSIEDEDTKVFVEESIKCYEGQLYRSAVVMSWIAAIDTLQKYMINNYVEDFNNFGKKVEKKWKPVKSVNDLSGMKEFDFIQNCASIGMISKNQKEELLKSLKLRNGCGHPNNLKVGPNMVSSHIETLLLNVFSVFE